MIQINNLDNLSKFLLGSPVPSFILTDEIPIYYDEQKNCLILDSLVPKYRKVPELASSRFLFSMKLLEAMANNYIPIFDKYSHRLLFTEAEYAEIKKKMSGLKYYGSEEYVFSDNLYFPGIEDYLDVIIENLNDVRNKGTLIENEIKRILKDSGLLKEDSFELVNTGSTARGTNLPGNTYDFDFVMKLEDDKLYSVITQLMNNLNVFNSNDSIVRNRRIRLKKVKIPGLSEFIDLDISFVPMREKYYSSDMALNDRLEQMKKQDINLYMMVIANIMHAKKILKEAQVYKTSRSDKSQSGLGGIGIENWILQNGGSFIDASKEFVLNSEGKDFIEFEKDYPIFDFGKDHINVAKCQFPYDNFVMKNMRETGYNKMRECLKKFIQSIENEISKKI